MPDTADMWRIAPIAALAFLLPACGAPDPAATLAARPAAPAAVQRYEQMQKEIRYQLDAALGPFPWRVLSDAARTPCPAPFAATNGVVVMLRTWGFDGGVPDAEWAQARGIIADVVVRYGFPTPAQPVDEPGRHESDATGPQDGATITFHTDGTSVMQVTTGCHRPA